jgi:hypothetical protein
MKHKTNTPFILTQEDYVYGDENGEGFCLACREQAFGYCEPDARNYKCEECGEHQVFGLGELLIMGLIEFKEEE